MGVMPVPPAIMDSRSTDLPTLSSMYLRSVVRRLLTHVLCSWRFGLSDHTGPCGGQRSHAWQLPRCSAAWGSSPGVAATALASAFTPSLLLFVLRSIAGKSDSHNRCMSTVCQQSVHEPEPFIAFTERSLVCRLEAEQGVQTGACHPLLPVGMLPEAPQ